MNKNHSDIDDALLISHLEGTTTVVENARIIEWLAASDENRATFKASEKIWKASAITADFDVIDTDASWSKVKEKLQETEDPKVRRPDFSIFLKIAAAILLLVGISTPFFLTNDTTLIADTTQEYQLPDGTTVWLRAGSELTYEDDFNESTRRVEMKGEGYFIVAKDAKKPFTLELNNTTTTVLGTQFNLKESKGITTLTLEEGSVKFSNEAASKIIKNGETIIALADGTLSVQNTVGKNFDAWKTNKLQFNNIALSVVLSDIENTYLKTISVENKSLLNCRLTSTFTDQSLDNVLRTLSVLYKFTVEKKNDVIVLREGNCPL